MKKTIACLTLVMLGATLVGACDVGPSEPGEESEELGEAPQASCSAPDYTSQPSYDYSGTLVSSNNVHSTGNASGGCDMFILRALASPPSNRARWVHIETSVLGDCDLIDYDMHVWKGTAGGWTGNQLTGISETQRYVGPFMIPWCDLEKTYDLGSTNSYIAALAGVHVEGDEPDVFIEIYE